MPPIRLPSPRDQRDKVVKNLLVFVIDAERVGVPRWEIRPGARATLSDRSMPRPTP